MRFVPCAGKEACTEGGTHCRACGRSFDEVERLRALIDSVVDFVETMGYENYEELIGYLGSKSLKKIRHRRKGAAAS